MSKVEEREIKTFRCQCENPNSYASNDFLYMSHQTEFILGDLAVVNTYQGNTIVFQLVDSGRINDYNEHVPEWKALDEHSVNLYVMFGRIQRTELIGKILQEDG